MAAMEQSLIEQYKDVYVFAQQVDNEISPIAFELLGKAKDLAKQYAILEIKNKVCPFKIIRKINDKIEIWDVNDLELLEDE